MYRPVSSVLGWDSPQNLSSMLLQHNNIPTDRIKPADAFYNTSFLKLATVLKNWFLKLFPVSLLEMIGKSEKIETEHSKLLCLEFVPTFWIVELFKRILRHPNCSVQ